MFGSMHMTSVCIAGGGNSGGAFEDIAGAQVSTRDAEINVSSGDTVCFNVLVLLSRVRVVIAIPQSGIDKHSYRR